MTPEKRAAQVEAYRLVKQALSPSEWAEAERKGLVEGLVESVISDSEPPAGPLADFRAQVSGSLHGSDHHLDRHPDPKPMGQSFRSGPVTRSAADPVLQAWTSGDLDMMLKALPLQTSVIDRHFLLMGIVTQTYKRRSEVDMAAKCAEVAELHLSEIAEILPGLTSFLGVVPPVGTFQHYATLLTERGDFDRAVAVCETAMAHGLHDGTKSDYPGRIKRIRKKQASEFREGGAGHT